MDNDKPRRLNVHVYHNATITEAFNLGLGIALGLFIFSVLLSCLVPVVFLIFLRIGVG
jgi:hypothetical protein